MAVFRTLEVQVNDEASFGEYASAPASCTYDTRLPVRDCKVTLEEGRFADTSYQSRQNHSQAGFRGTRRAEIELTMAFGGHSAATSGALTATKLYNLLGDGLGGKSAAATGTTVATAGTASSWTGAASTGWAAGMIGRMGVNTDARGKGQCFALGALPGSHVFTSLTALDAAPTAVLPDVIHAMLQAYPIETLGTSKRFCVGHAETGNQYHLMGCSLAGLTVNIANGGDPTITLRFVAAYWDRYALTIPSALSMSANDSAPVAGGSLFFQTVGTTTRATISAWDVTLALDLGLVENHTPGGGGTYQTVTSHSRTKCIPTITITAPWATAYEDLWNSDGSSGVYKHILWQSSTVDGRVVGFYLPSAYVSGPRPTVSESNEQTAHVVTLTGREGPLTTNDLTRSAVRFFMG